VCTISARLQLKTNPAGRLGDLFKDLGRTLSSGSLGNEWSPNIRADLLAGLVVALALIPEAIAFSIIAGVDPKVGLYASFSIAVIVAITGGRPGMISAATAATAVLMVTLVKDHGLQYLFAATILAIFAAQLPELIGVPALTYVMVAAGLAIIYLFPRITTTIPSPLVCILLLTAVSMILGLDIRTVGENHSALFGSGRRCWFARIVDDGNHRRRTHRYEK